MGITGIATVVAATAAVAGVGTAVAGTVQQHEASSKAAALNKQEVAQQAAQQAQQKQLADLQAERYRMQQIRQSTVARSLALSNATGSGAQYGSGLQGGYGGIAGASNTNLLGGYQNKYISDAQYGITQNMSGIQSNQAGVNGQYYGGAGLTSLGGELISAMGPIGRLGSSLGSFKGWDTSYKNNYVD